MPRSVANHLNRLMSTFLLGGDAVKSKIHWVNWNQVCSPLSCGGLGVAQIELLNRDLLGKWVWHFGNEPSILWRRVSISKSFFSDDPFGQILRSNLVIQVGDDKSILLWTDIWVGEMCLKEKVLRIYALALSKFGHKAYYGCKVANGSSDGAFLVNSLRKLNKSLLLENPAWKDIVWLDFAPPKVEIFVWQVLWGVGGFVCISFGPADVSSSLEWYNFSMHWSGLAKNRAFSEVSASNWLKAKFLRACVSVEQLMTNFSLASNCNDLSIISKAKTFDLCHGDGDGPNVVGVTSPLSTASSPTSRSQVRLHLSFHS
ncbi:hypothetical protein GQ457_13G015420 [Hibiscus cannabinus]